MRKTALAVLILLAAAGTANAGAPIGPQPEPEKSKVGRSITLHLPLGQAVVYLPAGHDARKLWPLIVFLPGYQKRRGSWLDPWKRAADRHGFIVAFPRPSKPDLSAGYPDIVPLAAVRAAVGAAAADPDRVAIVGHLAGGYGASNTVFRYPRLARTLVVVGSVPGGMRAKKDLAPRLPRFLFLMGGGRIRKRAEAYRKANPNLKIAVAPLDRAERAFAVRSAAPALAWISRQFPLGAAERRKPPDAKPDPEECAALVEGAVRLRARGAEAGAYITLLRATRLDPKAPKARLELARLCLASRRFTEALEWCTAAARLAPRDPRPHLMAAEALLKMGRARTALKELKAAGRRGRRLAAIVKRRSGDLQVDDPAEAYGHYRKAVAALRSGKFDAAAAAARAMVRAAPCEASYRAGAVYMLTAAGELGAAEKMLVDYLELFPEDPYIKPLAAALAETRTKDYSQEGLPPKAEVRVGPILPAGPAAGLLTAMAVKRGEALDPEALARALAARGAGRDLRRALPLLVAKRIPFAVGNGSLEDLRAKMAKDIPVLVQLPPGELAGLRPEERFGTGLPRLVVGYDQKAKCVLVRDYGAAQPVRMPYALFDLLWSRLDRWWLVLLPKDGKAPGEPGNLTDLELATGLAQAGSLRAALKKLESAGKTAPGRVSLARGLVLLRQKDYLAARKCLAGLAGAPSELSVQAQLALGTIEERSTAGSAAERLEKALPHYRRAWRLDPGSGGATLAFAATLMSRDKPGDAEQAKRMLADFLRYRPMNVPILRLFYSR